MEEQVAHQFIDALHALEDHQNIEPIVGTYAETCEVGNIISPEVFHGAEGAREFWTKYRAAFGKVHSEFRNIIGMNGAAALEWTTEGTNPEGDPFSYDGVSMMDIRDGKITRFRAYFNPVALGHQLIEPEKRIATGDQQ